MRLLISLAFPDMHVTLLQSQTWRQLMLIRFAAI